jgi:hypothetical protein
MTTRLLAAPVLLLVATVLAGCGAKSNQPTAQERDLGPASTKILGGTADAKYLHIFSASISTAVAGAPRFAATLLYVGTGSDQLVRVKTPLGNATVAQSLDAESAVPISVPLHSTGDALVPGPGSTVSVTVRLADHGAVTLTVPIVGPTPSSPPTSS